MQQKRQNTKKSSVRAKVEHVFAVVKGLLAYRKTRYWGLRKQTLKLNILFALANLYLTDGLKKCAVLTTDGEKDQDSSLPRKLSVPSLKDPSAILYMTRSLLSAMCVYLSVQVRLLKQNIKNYKKRLFGSNQLVSYVIF